MRILNLHPRRLLGIMTACAAGLILAWTSPADSPNKIPDLFPFQNGAGTKSGILWGESAGLVQARISPAAHAVTIPNKRRG